MMCTLRTPLFYPGERDPDDPGLYDIIPGATVLSSFCLSFQSECFGSDGLMSLGGAFRLDMYLSQIVECLTCTSFYAVSPVCVSNDLIGVICHEPRLPRRSKPGL